MTRRNFIKNTAVAGSAFVIGMYIPPKARAAAVQTAPLKPNAFIEITEDNTISFIIGQVEMGQGTYTTLAMCLAEELDVEWENICIKPAPVAQVYARKGTNLMLTGGSSSIRRKQEEMRKVGAAIHEMLLNAASREWKTSVSNLKTEAAHVVNTKTGESVPYGRFVKAISAMKVPSDPKVKALKECTLIGKPTKRHPKEAWAKVTGKAEFGIDVRIENLKYAAVLHPKVFGAKLASFDGSKALKRKGVLKVKAIPNGVAVIAEHWWEASEALQDIDAKWDEGDFAKISTPELHRQFSAMMQKPGASAQKDGNTQKAFKDAVKVLEVEYNFPYLAHAAMEPLGVTVHHDKEKATIWSSSQGQTWAQDAAVKVLGVKPEDITYNTPFLGSAFGRRGTPSTDFIMDGLHVAKDESYPVMTLWRREDDIKGGYYRPMSKTSVKLAIDKKSAMSALECKVVIQQLLKGTPFEGGIKNGFEQAQVEGLAHHPYAIENNDIQAYAPDLPVTVLWLRSVGHTHTAPILEGIVDEAAHAAGADALQYRLANLKEPRHIALLKDVARLSGWEQRKKEKNVGYGVAVVQSFGSVCAQVVKVRAEENDFKVENVWCSIDCGFAFNPLNVENQMISAINFGIAMLKYSEITIKNGAAEQNNFYDYFVSRISDAPEIEVSIVNSDHPIGGIGEPGVPPILAAVPNALFDATGKRYRSMPIRIGDA